ncbi:BsuPI-related putative proteinase inhibitor [Bacillus salitolerans]|uniref:Intracellular proteinase inhibitor BsuPI domain-containing protein n=1 Tax=Bacillus salitolerans TaxID=1437434 RepID=A0ABW4LQL0_9BACI
MKKKILYIVGTSILITSLLAGCGTKSIQQDEVSAIPDKMEEKEDLKQDEGKFLSSYELHSDSGTIGITYEFKNVSGQSQTLTFPNGLRADCMLFNENGDLLYQHSSQFMVTQAIEEQILEPNESIITDFMMSELPDGKYQLVMFTTSNGEEGKITTDITIENSIYHKEKGKLVGWADNHSVEFDVNGEVKTFQLTDIAIEQISTLEEGDEVEISYTVTEIEAPTIIHIVVPTKKVVQDTSVLA